MTLRARLCNSARWRQAAYDVGLWFLFGLTLTLAAERYVPGYPILVGTPSIPTGVYWLNKAPPTLQAGHTVTFPFEPTQPWLQGRYGEHLLHTKLLLGVAGDIVRHNGQGLEVCPAPDALGKADPCRPAGVAQAQDSRGRPLYSWLAAGEQYVLKPGEGWAHGPHPRSLDSRYHGPIDLRTVRGRATPILLVPMGE